MTDYPTREYIIRETTYPDATKQELIGELVRCKDCSKWCICHHSENWFCADGTPINTASDFYDDKGKRINNLQTYKSIHGERKDGEHDRG